LLYLNTVIVVVAVLCPEPPDSIPRGKKFGKVYETDSHVNYVCQTGYSIRGNAFFSGRPFIAVVCGSDGQWNADLSDLRCESM